jgi:hypothetical protein
LSDTQGIELKNGADTSIGYSTPSGLIEFEAVKIATDLSDRLLLLNIFPSSELFQLSQGVSAEPVEFGCPGQIG